MEEKNHLKEKSQRKELLLLAKKDQLLAGILVLWQLILKGSLEEKTVKKFQVVRILDEREAKRWAGENAPGALSIKKTQFNKIAKALDSLNFLEIDTEWRAQIASDLSMYEGDENA